MKGLFLGTNGWFSTPLAETTSTMIELDDFTVILDAGSGFTKIHRHLNQTKPVFLLLSHFHLDHIIGLHTLLGLHLHSGLTIVGQPESRKILNQLINQPFTAPVSMFDYPVRIVELPGEEAQLPFEISSLPLIHAAPCVGYRFKLEGKIIAYCTDTGYCENAVALARNADLLITECTLRSGETKDWPHLNPEDAARIAREAGAKRLILTHFEATKFLSLEDRKEAEKAARKTFPEVIAAMDDMPFSV